MAEKCSGICSNLLFVHHASLNFLMFNLYLYKRHSIFPISSMLLTLTQVSFAFTSSSTTHPLEMTASADAASADCIFSVRQHTCAAWVKPPCGFLTFFPNGWEFLINFLHAYYTILSTLDYKFLFNYFRLWRNYAILSATSAFFTFH